MIKASETNYYQEKPEILWRKTTFSLFFLNHNIFYRGLHRHQIWRSRNLSVYKKLWQLVTTDKLTTYWRGKRNDYILAIYICKNLFILGNSATYKHLLVGQLLGNSLFLHFSLHLNSLIPRLFLLYRVRSTVQARLHKSWFTQWQLNEFLFCKLKSKPIIAFNF